MKKKLAVLAAGICALSLFLTGCSGEISNDYVTITKYKDVEIDKVDADAVSDNDVEAQINSVLQSKSTTTEVTDRAAQTGDTVTIDYEGKKDGVAFDGGTATDAQLTLGSGQFIDGFEDGVVGHNIGDTFDLDLTFPENYGNEDLAGQAVVFTVTLKGISQTDVPELTDEFVQSVSDTSKTVEEYKKEIKKMIPWMLLSFCIYFLIQIAAIVPSYVMSYIIDVVVPNGNIQKIILYILLFVLIPLVMGVGNSFYTYIMAIQCRIRSYDFNRRILSKLLCQNMTYLTVHSGGELSAKAMQEAE